MILWGVHALFSNLVLTAYFTCVKFGDFWFGLFFGSFGCLETK